MFSSHFYFTENNCIFKIHIKKILFKKTPLLKNCHQIEKLSLNLSSHFCCSQKDIANMKNELEKRQREDESTVKANQSTQQIEASENGCDNTEVDADAAPALSNGINTTPTKLVTC